MLKITEYGDRLLEDLELVDWPAGTKIMQQEWIGRSFGAEVDFDVNGHDAKVTVFTTRPDTLFGATYMVLAPEHPLVESITSADCAEAVSAYVEAASRKSERDRVTEVKTKTGVFTGAYATNPVNDTPIPNLDQRLRPGDVRNRRDPWPCPPMTNETTSSRRPLTSILSKSYLAEM